MNSTRAKDLLIGFLTASVLALVSYIFFIPRPTNSMSERDSERLKAQLSDNSNRRGSEKDVDPYEKNEVKNTILKGAADSIQSCFKSWVHNQSHFTSGKIIVDWQIQPDGTPLKPEIVSSDISDINNCVLNSLSSLKFPPPPTGKPWYVVHKFFFKKEDPQDKK